MVEDDAVMIIVLAVRRQRKGGLRIRPYPLPVFSSTSTKQLATKAATAAASRRVLDLLKKKRNDAPKNILSMALHRNNRLIREFLLT